MTRHIVISGFIFVFLLLITNIAAGVWLDFSVAKNADGTKDGRINYPAYADKERARAIFRDFYNTKYAYAPFEAIRLLPHKSETTNVDEKGLRVTTGSRVGGRSLRVFGGSTVWGTGSADEGTIPSLLQEQFSHLRVVNHGQSGHVSGQELAGLQRVLMRGEPVGTVVFYDGVNDIFMGCNGTASLDGHGFENQLKDIFARELSERKLRIRAWNAIAGNIFDLLSPPASTTDARKVPAIRCNEDLSAISDIVSTLITNWNSARVITEANGGDFLAVLQPVSMVGSPRRDYLPETQDWDRWFNRAYGLIRDRMADTDWFIDLSNVLDGTTAYYIDYAHVTQNGNSVIADRIGSILLERFPSHQTN